MADCNPTNMGPLEFEHAVEDRIMDEWESYFIIVSNHNAYKLHHPGPNSTCEAPQLMCNRMRRNDQKVIKAKDAAVFPPSHRNVCKQCRKRLIQS